MPAKGTSEGFKPRNITVGKTWSSYTEDEKKIFSPEYFERLVLAIHGAFVLTANPASLPEQVTAPANPTTFNHGLQPLTTEEQDLYIPIFKRLVNTNKVLGDVKHGRLCRHSGKSKSNKLDKLMKGEINKVIRQVSIHVQYVI